MGTVHSVRLGPEEERIVERTRRRLRLKSKSDAIKHLIRAGEKDTGTDPMERLFAFRLPPEFRGPRGRSLTGAEIDDVVAGGDP